MNGAVRSRPAELNQHRGQQMKQGYITSVAAALVALCGGVAQAQITEDRLKELIREAAAAIQAPSPSAVQVPGEGPTLALTLDDAVRFALERNLDIAVQRLNPQLQDIAIATARAAYSPSLTSTLGQSNNVNAPTSQLQLSQGGGGVTNRTLTYNAGLTKNLNFWGGAFTATLNNARQATNSNNAFYNPQFNSTWTLSYVQPLFRDFKIDTQRRALVVAQVNRDISEVQLRASITNLVSNVRNAYWDYVFTTQAVEVARQSFELASKLVQDNQTRVEVGTMAPIDVVQAQAEQATRRQALVTAENNRRTAELALKRLIVSGTEDANWAASLDPVDRPDFLPEPVDIESAIRTALSQRTDLEIAKRNLENNTTTINFLRNQTLPIVDFQVNYGVQGVGGPRLERSNTGVLGSQITQTIPGGFADALESLFANRYPRWTAQLNLTYPIGTSTQDAAVARARVQLSQIQAQLRQMELTVATDVTNAAIQVRNTAEAVQASQAARELSQRRLEAEQSKFEVGMSTNYFVVQAQRDLNDARNSELRAILNYRKALVEFERLQQTTLSNANITVIAAGGGGGGF
jgi:outer membrane protein TolC